MNWTYFFFSLEGRISLKQYWFYFLLPTLVLTFVIGALAGGFEAATDRSVGQIGGRDWIAVLWGLAILWPGIATQVKRWHDRGKSGWWYLINFVPVIGGIWALIETGFLPGTEGENRFGPPPAEEFVS